MKVSHTVEIDEDARIGISMVMTGSLKPASRDICNKWLDLQVKTPLALRREAVAGVMKTIADGVVLSDPEPLADDKS